MEKKILNIDTELNALSCTEVTLHYIDVALTSVIG